jgi:exosortase D (VPLPA-CTERM-specific)
MADRLATTVPAHTPAAPAGWRRLLVPALVVLVTVCLLVIFRDALGFMLRRWGQPQYLHAILVPFVALYLVAAHLPALVAADGKDAWWSLAVLLAALGLQALGELSAVFELAEYGFVVGLWGLALAALGWRGVRVLWGPLVFLLWMVPLAQFIERRMFSGLLALSGSLAESLLRATGFSALAEGGSLNLGSYLLPLADAGTTTPFLLPLLCISSLLAVLVRGRWWQRLVLLLALIPVTIILDGLRMAVFGMLLNRSGLPMAHTVLGPAVTVGLLLLCLLLLGLLVSFFARLEHLSTLKFLKIPVPEMPVLKGVPGRLRANGAVLAGSALLVAATAWSLFYTRPPALIPERASLGLLPMQMGAWTGRREFMDRESLDTLKLADYSMTTFKRPSTGGPVTMWIAYYSTQVQGTAVHSPQACLPGDGWRIENIEVVSVPAGAADGSPQRVNRVLIAMGEQRQLVYYWFAQRGRTITNEFLVKWFIFWDGLTQNRTDGALVRLTTPVSGPAGLAGADARLEEFLKAAAPELGHFLPGADARVAVNIK